MIRLNLVQTVGGEIKGRYYTKIPLLIAFWSYSSKPSDWCFLCLGWEFCIILYDFMKVRRKISKKCERKYEAKKKEIPGIDSANGSIFITQQGLPNDAFIHICSFLHPKDVTSLACLNTTSSIQANDNDLWAFLWYRDYGDVLLNWGVGRKVLAQSLSQLSTYKSLLTEPISQSNSNSSDEHVSSLNCEDRLDISLAKYFDDFSSSESIDHFRNQTELNQLTGLKSLKEFYFVFGEVFMNYMLAGRNSLSECLLGLHGHIFDFTKFSKYHPGLVDPILWECGRDATKAFENIPHSRGARDIARELCVVVNLYYLSSSTSSLWGLYLPTSSKHLSALLENSNTLPISRQLQQIRSQRKHGTGTNVSNSDSNRSLENKEESMLEHVLPKRVNQRQKRPPTLDWIRKKLENDEKQLLQKKRTWSLVNNTELDSNTQQYRFYFDPIQQKWMKWNCFITAKSNCDQTSKFLHGAEL